MVHCSQVSEELSLSRDDEDDSKVKAMEFFCPPASEVVLHWHAFYFSCSGVPESLFLLPALAVWQTCRHVYGMQLVSDKIHVYAL